MMEDFFRSLKIANKIAVIFFLLLFMMGIGGSVGLYNAIKIGAVTELLYHDTFKRAEALSNLEMELLSQHQELFMYIVVSEEGSRHFLKSSIAERSATIGRFFADYRSMGVDEKSEKIFNDFISNLRIYRETQDAVMRKVSEKKTPDAISFISGEGSRNFNHALNSLKNLIEVEKAKATLAYQESEYFGKIIISVTVFFTIAAIVIAIGAWWMLSRSIVRPIIKIEESARKMGRGDLKERVKLAGSDEIGALAKEFNKMASNIESHYETLENRIEERTEELKVVNDELHKSKRELEMKNDELERTSRMKSQFLANVSHELRTPLNSIIGFSELLQERNFGELNEKQSQYVKFINTSGAHLLQLINSILDLSKIEAGRMELIYEEFNLVELLSEVIGTIKPMAYKKNLQLITKTVSASPVIRADKSKFKQIMFNLLSNAVKFNVEGGKVEVDWDVKDEPRGMTMQRYLYISVLDTGVGIKEEDIKRLFTEFEQLDTSITRDHGGTGLGLVLTRRLVELHHGDIGVESEYGKWCKFTARLPQEIERVLPVSTQPKVTGETEKPGAKPLIIVTGESKDISQLLEIYLDGENYEVITAENGMELIEKAKEKKPFAIVTGIAIPGKDGWDVMKELKSMDETKDIPVIIVSAANNKELGFALGAMDYLEKPVDKNRLIQTLKRISFTNLKKGRFNILVVDDEPQVLELFSDILEPEGFGVFKAERGGTAIDMAMELKPDLIILDLMMPEMSGFEVVERLKLHDATRDIPIIIFTAKDITPEEKIRLGSNIERVIRKAGFSKEDLLKEVKLLELAYPEKANMVDRVTKLFNRRYFDSIFEREISRSGRYGQPLSVLFIDIDDFTSFNRENGITLGDETLKELTRMFINNLRKADCVTRYGGDEFAVLLPEIEGHEARHVADKLRRLVDVHAFPSLEGKGHLTVSIGVVSLPLSWKERGVKPLQDVVKKVYSTGGNRVAVYKEESSGGG